jgi:hypothetical protein
VDAVLLLFPFFPFIAFEAAERAELRLDPGDKWIR